MDYILPDKQKSPIKFNVAVMPVSVAEKLPPLYGETHFPERTEKSKSFLRRDDALRSIGGGVLLYEILGINESDLMFNKYKKPMAKDKFFNLSHSGKYVILATDDKDVGCDIEVVGSPDFRVAKRVFLQDEQEWMSFAPLDRFYIIWTLKESVMKQQGLGLKMPPDSFSVMPLINREGLNVNGVTLYSDTVKYDNHYISVCSANPVREISLKFLTEI